MRSVYHVPGQLCLLTVVLGPPSGFRSPQTKSNRNAPVTNSPQQDDHLKAGYGAFLGSGVGPAYLRVTFAKWLVYYRIVNGQVTYAQSSGPQPNRLHKSTGGDGMSTQQTIEGIMGTGWQQSGQACPVLSPIQQKQPL